MCLESDTHADVLPTITQHSPHIMRFSAYGLFVHHNQINHASIDSQFMTLRVQNNQCVWMVIKKSVFVIYIYRCVRSKEKAGVFIWYPRMLNRLCRIAFCNSSHLCIVASIHVVVSRQTGMKIHTTPAGETELKSPFTYYNLYRTRDEWGPRSQSPAIGWHRLCGRYSSIGTSAGELGILRH
jgi:hypothetical protein